LRGGFAREVARKPAQDSLRHGVRRRQHHEVRPQHRWQALVPVGERVPMRETVTFMSEGAARVARGAG
jgi:hypothetical protein